MKLRKWMAGLVAVTTAIGSTGILSPRRNLFTAYAAEIVTPSDLQREESKETKTEAPTTAITKEPTAAPTKEVTPAPTAVPTEKPTAVPTAEPTEEVTAAPTAEPTEEVTAAPTAEPTEEVTAEPTAEPTEEATEEPTAEPTEEVTVTPTAEPTEEVTAEPTEEVTVAPTAEPTAEVTAEPTAEPTTEPNQQTSGYAWIQYGTELWKDRGRHELYGIVAETTPIYVEEIEQYQTTRLYAAWFEDDAVDTLYVKAYLRVEEVEWLSEDDSQLLHASLKDACEVNHVRLTTVQTKFEERTPEITEKPTESLLPEPTETPGIGTASDLTEKPEERPEENAEPMPAPEKTPEKEAPATKQPTQPPQVTTETDLEQSTDIGTATDLVDKVDNEVTVGPTTVPVTPAPMEDNVPVCTPAPVQSTKMPSLSTETDLTQEPSVQATEIPAETAEPTPQVTAMPVQKPQEPVATMEPQPTPAPVVGTATDLEDVVVTPIPTETPGVVIEVVEEIVIKPTDGLEMPTVAPTATPQPTPEPVQVTIEELYTVTYLGLDGCVLEAYDLPPGELVEQEFFHVLQHVEGLQWYCCKYDGTLLSDAPYVFNQPLTENLYLRAFVQQPVLSTPVLSADKLLAPTVESTQAPQVLSTQTDLVAEEISTEQLLPVATSTDLQVERPVMIEESKETDCESVVDDGQQPVDSAAATAADLLPTTPTDLVAVEMPEQVASLTDLKETTATVMAPVDEPTYLATPVDLLPATATDLDQAHVSAPQHDTGMPKPATATDLTNATVTDLLPATDQQDLATATDISIATETDMNTATSTDLLPATSTDLAERTLQEVLDAEHPGRRVDIQVSWEGETLSIGSTVILTARLHDYDGLNLTLFWEVNDGTGWKLHASNCEAVGFILDETNRYWQWRAGVTITAE